MLWLKFNHVINGAPDLHGLARWLLGQGLPLPIVLKMLKHVLSLSIADTIHDVMAVHVIEYNGYSSNMMRRSFEMRFWWLLRYM